MDPKLAQAIELMPINVTVGVCVGYVAGCLIWALLKLAGLGAYQLFGLVIRKDVTK